MTELAFRSAGELIEQMDAGAITSRDLLDLYLDRIERYDGRVNAVVALDVERARQRADAADAARARGVCWGPLHGLPITVKDCIETEGLRTTAGSERLATHVPERDATVVERLKRAGGVVFGKTNTPEFTFDWQTTNTLHGTTNNPWDEKRSPGGSSGGSAAAIAAGFTALEVGSDIGGSIRIPAHCCGIFGHKPTWGIVPQRGHIPGLPGSRTETDINVLGPLARSAGDLELALDVLAGPGDLDARELLERVGAAFGAWPAGEVPDAGPPLPAPTPTERRILIVDRPDLTQARITLAHEGISRTDPDRIAAGLLSEAIGGGGFSSRLMQRVRADAGLTYGVSSSFNLYRGGGTFAVSTFTRVAEVRTVIDLLLTELERARREPPSGLELEEIRALQVGQFSLGIETSDAVLNSLVNLDIYGLPEDSLDTYRARIRSVTAADIARLALELLHPDRAAIVLVGPAEALVPQLQDLGPIEVVQP